MRDPKSLYAPRKQKRLSVVGNALRDLEDISSIEQVMIRRDEGDVHGWLIIYKSGLKHTLDYEEGKLIWYALQNTTEELAIAMQEVKYPYRFIDPDD